jgi:hypothetical protein
MRRFGIVGDQRYRNSLRCYRIENSISRTIFENCNALISRAAPVVLAGLPQTYVFKKKETACPAARSSPLAYLLRLFSVQAVAGPFFKTCGRGFPRSPVSRRDGGGLGGHPAPSGGLDLG